MPELVSILVLIAIFLVAALLPVHLGVLALGATYVVALIYGVAPEDIFNGFPSKLVILILGVTYLFSIAKANGTIDWLVDMSVKSVGERIALIPWIMFLVTAVIVSVGALNAAGIACVASVAMASAAKYRISQFLMVAMVANGANAGGFSPVSPLGVIVNSALEKNGITPQPITLYLLCFGFFTLVTAVIYVFARGYRDLRASTPLDFGSNGMNSPSTGSTAPMPDPAHSASTQVTQQLTTDIEQAPVRIRLTFRQGLTILAIAALLIGVLAFSLDVGLFAFMLAIPLALFATTESSKDTIARLPWSVVLLVGGILTYVGLAEHLGALEYVGELIKTNASPVIALLIVFYVGAISSTFAAGSAVLVATMPFLTSVLETAPEVGVMGAVAAMAISSLIVDLSPLSPSGAILLANQQGGNERVLWKQLILWGVLAIAFAPPVTWFIFVVIGG